MKQMNPSHRKIAPEKETTKKQSLRISISSLIRQFVLTPPLHGQCLGIGKTRIIVKIVRLFLFRNLSSERQVKARNPDASSGVGRYETGTFKTPVFWGPIATRKTTRFSVRDAKCKRRDPPCTELHGRYRRPKQLARNAKNPKQPSELKVESRAVLRTGQDPNVWVFSLCFVIVRKIRSLVLRVVMANAPTAQKRLYRRER